MAAPSSPFYQKAAVIHFWLILIVITLYYLDEVLVPLGFAALFAVLLNPAVEWLVRLKVPRILAIALTLFISIVVIGALAYFLYTQLTVFLEALPKLKLALHELVGKTQQWLAQTLRLGSPTQVTWLSEALDKNLPKSGKMVSKLFTAVSGLAIALTLIPVYVFLLLLYRRMLLNFIMQVFLRTDPGKVVDILHETRTVIQSYVIGLLIEALIVAVLNTGGLLLLGIQYAVLLGVLGALLNLVPYIGGLIAIALPVMIALVTKEGVTYPLLIIGLYSVIQFIDNNLIVPKIVAGRVKINAIISIVGVIAGGKLWGVSGMFLSIPFLAILKIIFDRIERLKPWGMLLGDEYPIDPSKLEKASTSTSFWDQNTTTTLVVVPGPDEPKPES